MEPMRITADGHTVRLSGELDVVTADAVTQAVARLIDPREIDLSDVTFMDSSGLHALLRLRSIRQLRINNPLPPVLRVVELTGTADLLFAN